jgi:peroxiredoxin
MAEKGELDKNREVGFISDPHVNFARHVAMHTENSWQLLGSFSKASP